MTNIQQNRIFVVRLGREFFGIRIFMFMSLYYGGLGERPDNLNSGASKLANVVLLCQVSEAPKRWIPAFAVMTANMGRVIGDIPAKAGIHLAQYPVS
jgi:hypothetical protein